MKESKEIDLTEEDLVEEFQQRYSVADCNAAYQAVQLAREANNSPSIDFSANEDPSFNQDMIASIMEMSDIDDPDIARQALEMVRASNFFAGYAVEGETDEDLKSGEEDVDLRVILNKRLSEKRDAYENDVLADDTHFDVVDERVNDDHKVNDDPARLFLDDFMNNDILIQNMQHVCGISDPWFIKSTLQRCLQKPHILAALRNADDFDGQIMQTVMQELIESVINSDSTDEPECFNDVDMRKEFPHTVDLQTTNVDVDLRQKDVASDYDTFENVQNSRFVEVEEPPERYNHYEPDEYEYVDGDQTEVTREIEAQPPSRPPVSRRKRNSNLKFHKKNKPFKTFKNKNHFQRNEPQGSNEHVYDQRSDNGHDPRTSDYNRGNLDQNYQTDFNFRDDFDADPRDRLQMHGGMLDDRLDFDHQSNQDHFVDDLQTGEDFSSLDHGEYYEKRPMGWQPAASDNRRKRKFSSLRSPGFKRGRFNRGNWKKRRFN